jgi:hypothetical protein
MSVETRSRDFGNRGRAMQTTVTVSVVLPCLNEARSVGHCVDEALDAIRRAGWDGEVVVVDNGSTDGSPDIAAAHGARVIHEGERGYGAALTRGFASAYGDVVVMADADLTYPLDKLAMLVQPVLDNKADIVYGGRLEAANRKIMPALHRYVGTPTLTFLVARACGRGGLRDSQTGYRAFRRSTILSLDIRSSGMELNSELLIKAAQAGLRLREIPTGYRARVGESKLETFSDGWRNLRTILLLAPEVLLIWPGATLAVLGLIMSAVTISAPQGIPIGSMRWQPVFFSSIAIVLGTCAAMGGVLLANRSVLVAQKVRQRYAWVGKLETLRRVMILGAVLTAGGLAIDVALLINWAMGNSAPSRGQAFAALAQSAMMLGVVFFISGLVSRLLSERRSSGLVVLVRDELSDRAAS